MPFELMRGFLVKAKCARKMSAKASSRKSLLTIGVFFSKKFAKLAKKVEKWRKFYFQPNLFGGNGEFLMRLDTAFEALLTSASPQAEKRYFSEKKDFYQLAEPQIMLFFCLFALLFKKSSFIFCSDSAF